jgi:vancomycin permeability regulator SanA
VDTLPEELQQIAQYLDVHSEPTHADLAFLFGTRLPDPAHIALRLYSQQLVPMIVVTGGYNRKYDVEEAYHHRDILLCGGVPRDQIVVEDRSTNTLENVQFALPLIARQLPLGQITRVLVVAKWFHSRRAVMTLKRHLPLGVRYFPVTYEPEGIGRHNWFREETYRAYVLGNWECLPRYLARGHLLEIQADDDGYV